VWRLNALHGVVFANLLFQQEGEEHAQTAAHAGLGTGGFAGLGLGLKEVAKGLLGQACRAKVLLLRPGAELLQVLLVGF
jgi:hypothetical protein